MKNIILAFAAAITLASCAKEEQTPVPVPAAGDNEISVSFVAEPISAQSRAFFDASATTESWEKSLSSISLFCFNPDGSLIVRRNFTTAEVTAKKATFSLPRSAAGKSVEFYAIANTTVGDIADKAALLALKETSAALYNGTFAEVSAAAKRSGGFLMSGTATKTVAAAGQATDVAITLKRDVAKIAVQSSLSADFASKYPGKVKVNSATVSRAASQTPYFGGAAAPGAMTYTHTQTPQEASDKYNNLVYLFENGTLAAGSRVLLTLEATYDRDGDFSTTDDQAPITYEVELKGTSDNGTILRNGYYRVAVSLAGLTGQDVSATIIVADWETPVTQTINLGQ